MSRTYGLSSATAEREIAWHDFSGRIAVNSARMAGRYSGCYDRIAVSGDYFRPSAGERGGPSHLQHTAGVPAPATVRFHFARFDLNLLDVTNGRVILMAKAERKNKG